MFKFRSQVGSVLPRASFRQINHANIRQSWEECQQRSPLTPCVKALQWSADPWFSSRRPPGSPALMEILWMVFSFIETVGLTERLWDPDVLYGQSQANYLRRKGLQMLFSGRGTDMSINFHSRQRRIKNMENFWVFFEIRKCIASVSFELWTMTLVMMTVIEIMMRAMAAALETVSIRRDCKDQQLPGLTNSTLVLLSDKKERWQRDQ